MNEAPRHVLVTDASRGSAISFIRSLGSRGWKVTAADSDPASPGFRSRYTSRRLLHPRTRNQPDAVVDAIHRAVTDDRVDLVVPITDEIGLPLAAARDRFDGLTTLALPDPEAWRATHDKPTTIAIAERLGIPVPPTRSVHSIDEATAVAAELGYPVVVKPVSSRTLVADGTIAAHAVTYASTADDVRSLLERAGPAGVLLQPWVPGDGVGVELLMDHGRPIAAFQHRRLREFPPTGGASSLRESEDLDDDLYGHACGLLGELGWTGLAMVEFRRGRDGVGYFMEVNGRVWGSLPLAVIAGVDFPARLADLLLAAAPPPEQAVATDYRRGLRARNLRLEIAWIGSVLSGRHRHKALPWPGRGAALRAIASLADPRIADDVMRWSDPGPGLAQIAMITRDGFRRAGGRGV